MWLQMLKDLPPEQVDLLAHARDCRLQAMLAAAFIRRLILKHLESNEAFRKPIFCTGDRSLESMLEKIHYLATTQLSRRPRFEVHP